MRQEAYAGFGLESKEVRDCEKITMKETVEMPKSKFMRVACRKCKNEQVIFNKISTLVKCHQCNAELAVPTGGESEIRGKVLQELS